jgi:hypothetical protein
LLSGGVLPLNNNILTNYSSLVVCSSKKDYNSFTIGLKPILTRKKNQNLYTDFRNKENPKLKFKIK